MTTSLRARIEYFSTGALALLLSLPVGAGVVFEIEVTNHEDQPPSVDTMQTSVQDRQLKMEVASRGDRSEMIYRGEQREMVMVDHEERSYLVIDQEAIAEIGAKMSEANRMMAEALKNVPPEQRPMMEQMMKQRMPQMQPERPKTRLEKTGERANHSGYPCVKYVVIEGDRKVRELWVTDWDNVEGGEEVVALFKEMAEFFQEMLATLPRMGGGPAIDDNMFQYMNEMDGFPVLTREFSSGGALTTDSKLRSAERQKLEQTAFEPPEGYKRQNLFR